VNGAVDGLDLDPVNTVLAEVARMLGGKLDALAASESAASAQATPAIARELAATLRAIHGEADTDNAAALLRSMLEGAS
jgi:hypothetical protein